MSGENQVRQLGFHPTGNSGDSVVAPRGEGAEELIHQLPASTVGGCSWGLLTHQHSQPTPRVVGALGSGQQVSKW